MKSPGNPTDVRGRPVPRSRHLLSLLLTLVALALAPATPALASEGAPCPNEQVRLESKLNPNTGLPFSIELPECRAYELVTPPYTEGDVVPSLGFAAYGESNVVASTSGTFVGSANSLGLPGAPYQFTRDAEGWEPSALAPSASQFPAGGIADVSRDFSKTVWELRESSQSIHAGSFYLRESAAANGACPADGVASGGGCFVEVGPVVSPALTQGPANGTSGELFVGETGLENGTIGGGSTPYVGASANLSHIVFRLNTNQERQSYLWPGDTTVVRGAPSIYEYNGTDQIEPKLIGVSNEGTLTSDTDAHLIGNCGDDVGGGTFAGSSTGDKYNAVSTSGATVAFTVFSHDEAGATCTSVVRAPEVNELYVRENGERTLAISEPTLLTPGRECSGTCREDENEENGHKRSAGEFQGASEDGSKLFFLTNQPLVNSDMDTATDLYEEEIEGTGTAAKVAAVIQVSRDPNPGQAAEVQGVARVSEDGSHVYFVARGVLTGKNGGGESPALGADNLYVYQRDTANPSGALTFVASLSPSDAADWARNDDRPVQATPDGEFLVFQSTADLTSDDTSSVAQIFEYDATTQTLVRVSSGQCPVSLATCAPSERFDNDGNTSVNAAHIVAPEFEGQVSPLGLVKGLAISDSGTEVFFSSSDQLAPQAATGQEDAYEYHWRTLPESGNTSLVANGFRHLVEAGREAPEPVFRGTVASGEDVFVVNPTQYVSRATSTQTSLFDARLGGGFPAPAVTPECTGEACKTAVGASPQVLGPGSTGAPSLGNLPAGPLVFPTESAKAKPKPLTKAEDLSKALKLCRRDKSKSKRERCEATARKQYGPQAKPKRKTKR
jgi:hypothetical protein